MADGLGISEAMVSKLRKRGMPMGDVEKAKRWRNRHLEPARMKGTRFDAKAAPAVPRKAVVQVTLIEEARQLLGDWPGCTPLPERLEPGLRGVLRRMAFEEFARLYALAWGMDVVWKLIPASLSQWDDWLPADGDEDDDWVPLAPIDLPLLHLVVAGVAGFEWDPAAADLVGEKPAFRDCVRLAVG